MNAPLRILHIENDPHDAELIAAALAAGGIPVDIHVVDDRTAVRDFLSRMPFDIVLCDYSLPHYDGLTALADVRAILPDMPFIYVSGTIGEVRAIEALKQGATDYVLKQDLHRLAPAIERAMKEYEERRLRREAEAQLQQQQRTVQLIVDTEPESVCVIDGEGRIAQVNPAGVRIFGARDSRTVVGTHYEELVALEDRRSVRQAIRDAMAGAPGRVDFEVIALDGTKRSMEAHVVPFQESDDRAAGVLAIGRDVTEEKRAKAGLHKVAERFTKVFERSPVGISIASITDGRLIDMNAAGLAIFGYTREEMFRPPATIEALWVHRGERARLMGQVLRNGSVTDYPFTFRRKSGEKGIGITSVELIDLSGERCVLAMFQDVTERYRAEEELLRSEERFRSLYEHAPIGITSVDAEGRFLRCNAALEQILGYSSAELSAKTIDEVTLPEDIGTSRVNLNRFSNPAARMTTFEKRYVRKDGRIVWARVTASPVRDATDRFVHTVTMVEDITSRREADEALKRNEAQLRAIIDSLEEVMFEFDEEGTYLNVWTAREQLLAQPREKLIGHNVREFLPARLTERILPLFRRVFRTGISEQFEYRLSVAEGDRWFLGRVCPVNFEDGTRRSICMLAVDITDRKTAEEASRETATRLQAILDHSPAVIFLKDLQGRYLEVNRQFERVFGVTRDHALGRTDRELFSAEQAEQFQRNDEQVLQKGRPIAFEEVSRHPEGIRTSIVTKFPLQDAAGSTYGIGGLATDISERKQAERALQESEERFRGIYENSPVGMALVTASGRFTRSNPAFQRLVGYTTDELQHMTFADLTYPDDLAENSRRFLTVAQGDAAVAQYEKRYVHKNGSVVWARVALAAAHDPEDPSVRVAAVIQDITEQKQIQEHLRASQKMESLGQLAGGIAHDFNNILGIILAHTTLLQSGSVSTQRTTESLKTIVNAVHRGSGVVRQLLTFARKDDAEFRPVEVRHEIEELVKMLQETFPRTITFSVSFPSGHVALRADQNQIHQALLNLCVNARDAMPDGGPITIVTKRVAGADLLERHPKAGAHEYLVVSVSDRGIGMDEATKSRIFEPFFTTKEQGKGTGLGLAVVYGIVQTHRGLIDVESAPGKGSVFNLYFPLPSDGSDVQTPSAVVQEVPRGSETILVVEDEEELREALQGILEEHGYTVMTAGDGIKAVAIAFEHRSSIALVICDLGLPRFDGRKVIARLREMNLNTEVIVASGFVDPEARRQLTALGVREIIHKPYAPQDVLRKVRTALDSKKAPH